MPLYQKANDRFNQGDCSLASSSSWGQNNSLFPSSSLTSNATYLSPPKRCLIVPSNPSKVGLLWHSCTHTLVPGSISLGSTRSPPPALPLAFVSYIWQLEPSEQPETPLVSVLLSGIPGKSLVCRDLQLGVVWDSRFCIWLVLLAYPFL